MEPKKILILGLGNILLGDEGVGVRVTEQLLTHPLPDGIEVIDGGTAGYELINFFEGKEKVIIVDAVKTNDTPGSVYKLDLSLVQEDETVQLSLHQIGLKNVFKMASLMDLNPEVTLVGNRTERLPGLQHRSFRRGGEGNPPGHRNRFKRNRNLSNTI